MKPKHRGGYTPEHADLCERTLVSLLRGLGPWKRSIYLIGGLVPRYLIAAMPPDLTGEDAPPKHIGTTDVDLVLDFAVLAEIEAYRRLEQNLQSLGFQRGTNDAGRAQHFSWRKSIQPGVTIVVDLLCDDPAGQPGQAVMLPMESRLSALKIPGAQLAIADHIEVQLTAELFDAGGVATELIRIANIIPFLILKCLAFEDRNEEKDAYDLIYCLTYYRHGPVDVAAAIVLWRTSRPPEPLLDRALAILRDRFASDQRTPGYRKNGPAQYARFLTDPGRPELNAVNSQHAATTVELLLEELQRRQA